MRSGGGPFFRVETYRHREHCGHNFDNELGYRTLEEFEFWKRTRSINLVFDVEFRSNQQRSIG